MNIIIGADELILWLRKNNKAIGVKNIDLGKRILKLIVDDLKQARVEARKESYWDIREDSKNIEEDKLPKNSEQYSVNINILPEIYNHLNNW